jgi:deoxyribonuclease-4
MPAGRVDHHRHRRPFARPADTSDMNIGAHASIAGGVQNAVDEQREYDGTCGQIFAHSPQTWAHPDIDDDDADAFVDATAAQDIGPWVIHSCYLVNLATPKDDLREKSIDSLQADLDAAAQLDIDYVNVHLGAHTGAGVDQGLDNAASAIDTLDVPEGVTLLVESDAGSGTKLGGDLDHLARVVELTDADIGICLDTAHLFAAGYDLSTPDGVDDMVTEAVDAVGADRIACVHLTDSKHACGTNKDEHAHLGEGEIGDAGIRAVVTHDVLADRPFVLETPTEDGRGFAWNVERARELAGQATAEAADGTGEAA